MNSEIVKKIKDARKERGLTQQDLADHLGKTAAAISDLERGKVQVSASDLFSVASLLEKPIEYFFGASIGNEYAEKIISAVQRSDEKAMREFVIMINYMDDITSFTKYLTTTYTKKDEKLSQEDILKFYNIIVPYHELLEEKRNEVLAMKTQLEKNLNLTD